MRTILQPAARSRRGHSSNRSLLKPRHVRAALHEGPGVSFGVGHFEHTDAIELVLGWSGVHSSGFHLIEHGIDIVHPDAHPLLGAPSLLRPIFRIALQPDFGAAGVQLGIAKDALRVHPASTLGEAEHAGEPLDHRGHIVVMQVGSDAFEFGHGLLSYTTLLHDVSYTTLLHGAPYNGGL